MLPGPLLPAPLSVVNNTESLATCLQNKTHTLPVHALADLVPFYFCKMVFWRLNILK